MSSIYGRRTESGRAVAGHASPADPKDACERPQPRLCHRATHPSDLEIGVEGRTRLALPRPAPDGTRWLDRVLLGYDGEQPQGEVLQVDATRRARAGRRNHAVGVDRDRHRRGPARGLTPHLT